MDLNTSPDGPVTEEVISEATDAVEMTDDQALEAAWEGLNSDEEADAPTDQPETAETEEAEDAPDDGEEAEEQEAAPVDVPQGLPAALRDQWRDIPESARQAILEDRDGLHRRLSDMGRQVQGISPIRDSLVQAIEKFPHLANMRPQDVGEQLLQLAEVSAGFDNDPLGTMVGLIDKHGLRQSLQQVLGGQNPSEGAKYVSQLQNRINSLEGHIQRLSNPEYLQEQVTNITTRQNTMTSVEQFAAQAEHWADLEDHIPGLIPIAQQKLGQSAAQSAVLEAAYNMAIEIFKPDAKAPKAAEPAAKKSDPEKAERALKAKSVNVKETTTSKRRTLTEDERLQAAWDRVHKSA